MPSQKLLKHCFIIINNTRLDFEDSFFRVSEFISKRLQFHGAESINYLADKSLLNNKIHEISEAGKHLYNYIVVVDIMNPITDVDLVLEMTASLNRTNEECCISDGAIPGTQVEKLIAINDVSSGTLDFDEMNSILLRWNSQREYNNQLNIYKYKRLKLFLSLIDRINDLHEKSIENIMETLASDDIYTLLASFGEDVKIVEYDESVHCGGELHSLVNDMSQPFCGFLPITRPMYHECESCGLVMQSPCVHEDDIHKVYDKWDKEDFVVSTNNPYTDDSVRCNLSKILPLLNESAATLDLGGGIGNYSKYLSEKYPEWDVTHSDFEIKSKVEGNLNSIALDFTNKEIGTEKYDLISAWEVIEHVPFHKLSYVLNNIWRALKPGGFFILSTPDFDSPLCKSFDFYATCPPFHYMAYGEKWLKNYFSNSNDFQIFDTKHCSDFLDDALNWYAYGASTCPSMALRSTSILLKNIFELDTDNSLKNKLLGNGLGTEIVMTLRKK